MKDKKHQSHTCEYQIRVDGKPVYYAIHIGQEETNKWLKLCDESPDCYVDIVRVNTHIVMCQAEYHHMKRHFENISDSSITTHIGTVNGMEG